MHEDKGWGRWKSIVFVPFLDEITTTSGGSSGNRRATSGNLRGRAENGEETTLGVGTLSGPLEALTKCLQVLGLLVPKPQPYGTIPHAATSTGAIQPPPQRIDLRSPSSSTHNIPKYSTRIDPIPHIALPAL